MPFQYKLLAAASAAALFAFPGAAQEAGAEAGLKVETPAADAQAEVGVAVQAETSGTAATAADAQEDSNGEASAADSAAADAAPADAAPAEAGSAAAATVIAATEADLRVGAAVLDPQGGQVGTVESVDAEGAVVSTGNARAKMPVSSFGKNERGLVISMTRAELEAAVSAQGGPESE